MGLRPEVHSSYIVMYLLFLVVEKISCSCSWYYQNGTGSWHMCGTCLLFFLFSFLLTIAKGFPHFSKRCLSANLPLASTDGRSLKKKSGLIYSTPQMPWVRFRISKGAEPNEIVITTLQVLAKSPPCDELG